MAFREIDSVYGDPQPASATPAFTVVDEVSFDKGTPEADAARAEIASARQLKPEGMASDTADMYTQPDKKVGPLERVRLQSEQATGVETTVPRALGRIAGDVLFLGDTRKVEQRNGLSDLMQGKWRTTAAQSGMDEAARAAPFAGVNPVPATKEQEVDYATATPYQIEKQAAAAGLDPAAVKAAAAARMEFYKEQGETPDEKQVLAAVVKGMATREMENRVHVSARASRTLPGGGGDNKEGFGYSVIGGGIPNVAYTAQYVLGSRTGVGVLLPLIASYDKRFQENRASDYKFGADGQLEQTKAGLTDAEAVAPSAVGAAAEVAAEAMGGKILGYAAGKTLGPLVEKFGGAWAKKALPLVRRFSNAVSDMEKVTKAGDYPGEIFENYLNEVADAAFAATPEYRAEGGIGDRFAAANKKFGASFADSTLSMLLVQGGQTALAAATVGTGLSAERNAETEAAARLKAAGLDDAKIKQVMGDRDARAVLDYVTSLSPEESKKAAERMSARSALVAEDAKKTVEWMDALGDKGAVSRFVPPSPADFVPGEDGMSRYESPNVGIEITHDTTNGEVGVFNRNTGRQAFVTQGKSLGERMEQAFAIADAMDKESQGRDIVNTKKREMLARVLEAKGVDGDYEIVTSFDQLAGKITKESEDSIGQKLAFGVTPQAFVEINPDGSAKKTFFILDNIRLGKGDDRVRQTMQNVVDAATHEPLHLAARSPNAAKAFAAMFDKATPDIRRQVGRFGMERELGADEAAGELAALAPSADDTPKDADDKEQALRKWFEEGVAYLTEGKITPQASASNKLRRKVRDLFGAGVGDIRDIGVLSERAIKLAQGNVRISPRVVSGQTDSETISTETPKNGSAVSDNASEQTGALPIAPGADGAGAAGEMNRPTQATPSETLIPSAEAASGRLSTNISENQIDNQSAPVTDEQAIEAFVPPAAEPPPVEEAPLASLNEKPSESASLPSPALDAAFERANLRPGRYPETTAEPPPVEAEVTPESFPATPPKGNGKTMEIKEVGGVYKEVPVAPQPESLPSRKRQADMTWEEAKADYDQWLKELQRVTMDVLETEKFFGADSEEAVAARTTAEDWHLANGSRWSENTPFDLQYERGRTSAPAAQEPEKGTVSKPSPSSAPKTYRASMFTKNGEERVEVKGKPVSLDGVNASFFVFSEGGKKGPWFVAEETTGKKVARGETEAEAVESANGTKDRIAKAVALANVPAPAQSTEKAAIEEVEGLTKMVKAANEANAARVKASGIDQEAPPLTKADVVPGETVYDFQGRPWTVSPKKKMIPSFSVEGVQGVRNEIVEGKEYPITSARKVEWGYTTDDIATWRRPVKKPASISTPPVREPEQKPRNTDKQVSDVSGREAVSIKSITPTGKRNVDLGFNQLGEMWDGVNVLFSDGRTVFAPRNGELYNHLVGQLKALPYADSLFGPQTAPDGMPDYAVAMDTRHDRTFARRHVTKLSVPAGMLKRITASTPVPPDNGGKLMMRTEIKDKGYFEASNALVTAPGETRFRVAYHGSPHLFDKFDLSRIGTGEGAQAYGHGLYFAQSPKVAEQYADVLSRRRQGIPQSFDFSRIPASAIKGREWISEALSDALDLAEDNVDPSNTDAGLIERALKNFVQERGMDNDDIVTDGEWTTLWDAMERSGAVRFSPSSATVYEVDIAVSDDQFLDWDTSFAKQSNTVRSALVQETQRENGPFRPGAFMGLDGASIYLILTDKFGSQKAASDYLHSLGIKGIRYYDGNSRASAGGEIVFVKQDAGGWKSRIKVKDREGTDMFTTSMAFPSEAEARAWAEDKIGNGTRNYVIFDDSLIKITKRNDTPAKGYGPRGETMFRVTREQTETPEFAKWFSGSKVVDADGKPLVVYHGGDPSANITAFDAAQSESGALWFTDSKAYADFVSLDKFEDEEGRTKTYSVFLSMQNPVDWRGKPGQLWERLRSDAAFVRGLIDNGYDGVILDDTNAGIKGTSYVTFSPSQIKSADTITRDDAGNVIPLSQRFNPASNDIRFRVIDRDDSAFYTYYDLREQYGSRRLREFEKSKGKGQGGWDYPNFARVKKIWEDFSRTGFVRDEKGMEDIADNIVRNIAAMEFEAQMAGHTDNGLGSSETLEEFEMGPWSDKKLDKYYDWTGLHFSDYAMAPLQRLAFQILRAETAEEKLLLVDRVFNTVHQASDLLAENFIQGGQASLNELAGTGLYGDAYKDANGVRSSDIRFRVPDYDLTPAELELARQQFAKLSALMDADPSGFRRPAGSPDTPIKSPLILDKADLQTISQAITGGPLPTPARISQSDEMLEAKATYEEYKTRNDIERIVREDRPIENNDTVAKIRLFVDKRLQDAEAAALRIADARRKGDNALMDRLTMEKSDLVTDIEKGARALDLVGSERGRQLNFLKTGLDKALSVVYRMNKMRQTTGMPVSMEEYDKIVAQSKADAATMRKLAEGHEKALLDHERKVQEVTAAERAKAKADVLEAFRKGATEERDNFTRLSKRTGLAQMRLFNPSASLGQPAEAVPFRTLKVEATAFPGDLREAARRIYTQTQAEGLGWVSFAERLAAWGEVNKISETVIDAYGDYLGTKMGIPKLSKPAAKMTYEKPEQDVRKFKSAEAKRKFEVKEAVKRAVAEDPKADGDAIAARAVGLLSETEWGYLSPADVMSIVTGYPATLEADTREELEKRYDMIRRQMLAMQRVDGMRAGKYPTPMTNPQDKPDVTLRQLAREVRDMMNDFTFPEGETDPRMVNAQQALANRLKYSIEELQKAIDTGAPTNEKAPHSVVETPEIKALRSTLKLLRAAYEALPAVEAIKEARDAERARRSANKRYHFWAKRVEDAKNGLFPPTFKGSTAADRDAEANAYKVKAEAARKEYWEIKKASPQERLAAVADKVGKAEERLAELEAKLALTPVENPATPKAEEAPAATPEEAVMRERLAAVRLASENVRKAILAKWRDENAEEIERVREADRYQALVDKANAIEAKIKAGDYTKTPKRPKAWSPRIAMEEDKVRAGLRVINERIEWEANAAAGFWGKARNANVFSGNVYKFFKASWDLSNLGVQSARLFSAAPVFGSKLLGTTVTSAWTDEKAYAAMEEMHNHPNYGVLYEAGLALDQQYDDIYGTGMGETVFRDFALRADSSVNPAVNLVGGLAKVTLASQRAFDIYGRMIRFHIANSILESPANAGLSKAEIRAVANMVNIMGGVGNTRVYSHDVSSVLSKMMWSSRLFTAQWQTLAGGGGVLFNAGMGVEGSRKVLGREWWQSAAPGAAKLYARSLAGNFALSWIFGGIGMMFGDRQPWEDDETMFWKAWDFLFGRRVIGSKNIDVTGGLTSYISLLRRVVDGSHVSMSGKTMPDNDWRAWSAAAGNFARGRLRPDLALALNVVFGADVTGEPFGPLAKDENGKSRRMEGVWNMGKEAGLPITPLQLYETVSDMWKTHGIIGVTAGLIPTLASDLLGFSKSTSPRDPRYEINRHKSHMGEVRKALKAAEEGGSPDEYRRLLQVYAFDVLQDKTIAALDKAANKATKYAENERNPEANRKRAEADALRYMATARDILRQGK